MKREELRTPCYVIQKEKLIKNLEILREICQETGCRILLAQKAFSMFAVYPLIGKHLNGAAASGLFEARLAAEELGKENHIFSPAYREEEMPEIIRLCDHIILNSPAQVKKYKDQILAGGKSPGLRSIPAFPPRRDMRYTIPVRRDPGLELPSIRLQKNYWMELRGFIFIPCANRIPMPFLTP